MSLMMTTWNVEVGSVREEISADLLRALGFDAPYSNDETNTARGGDKWPIHPLRRLAAAYATGLRGDAAALEAIRIMEERDAAAAIETARQRVAETELKAAQERHAAENTALLREREAREAARATEA